VPGLVRVIERSIEITEIDFGVIQGLRTIEEQEELYLKGATKTMNSNHLTGHAVDLMAYIGSRASWELNLYDNIADAVKAAAIEVGFAVRWGGSWTTPDIRTYEGTMEGAMNDYIDLRRSQDRRPFIDGPHFESA
jgi:peptidoglycan L-alanyl-D-glutamate endopeptidase CwlK